MVNGHLLIAKEKDPSAFIEFGPAGDQPSGFGSASALAEGARWPTDEGDHVFVPLRTAGLDDGPNSGLGEHIDAVTEWEECI